MEKIKNELPYYLRIDKRKDGSPVISMRLFRLTAFLQTAAFMVIMGIAAYTLISSDFIINLYWHILAICSASLMIIIMLLIGLRELFLKTKIILETDALVKKTTWNKQIIPAKDIVSIRVEAPILQVLESPFSNKMQTIQKKELIIKLYDGKEILLLDNFEDIQPALHLRDYINNYYGLGEKPKTSNE